MRILRGDRRGVTAVIGNLLLVMIVIILTATITATIFGGFDATQHNPPKIAFEHEVVDVTDNSVGNNAVKLTLTSGQSINARQLLVRSTKDVDIAGSPDSEVGEKSKAEYFAEPVNDPEIQAGTGDQWDAGETTYLIGDDLDGETMQVVWAPEQIQDQNPGYVNSDSSYVIAEFTVGED